jgi:hypothetical protein
MRAVVSIDATVTNTTSVAASAAKAFGGCNGNCAASAAVAGLAAMTKINKWLSFFFKGDTWLPQLL